LHIETLRRHFVSSSATVLDDVVEVGSAALYCGATDEREQVPNDLGGTVAAARACSRSSRLLPVVGGISSSVNPTMACNGLLSSWATPEASWPTAARRSLWIN
jgi:hypothetical protein